MENPFKKLWDALASHKKRLVALERLVAQMRHDLDCVHGQAANVPPGVTSGCVSLAAPVVSLEDDFIGLDDDGAIQDGSLKLAWNAELGCWEGGATDMIEVRERVDEQEGEYTAVVKFYNSAGEFVKEALMAVSWSGAAGCEHATPVLDAETNLVVMRDNDGKITKKGTMMIVFDSAGTAYPVAVLSD